MTNRLALYLAAVILAFIAVDLAVLEGAVMVFLGRKFLALTEYVAFWR